MRVVICPDKFAGTVSAVEAANAIADGWRSVAPADELQIRPVADGGPGFVEVLHASLGGELVDVPTTDPLGRPVTGRVLIVDDTGGASPTVVTNRMTAYVESAHACGLHHLAEHERDPKVTTSFGLGALILAAATAGNGTGNGTGTGTTTGNGNGTGTGNGTATGNEDGNAAGYCTGTARRVVIGLGGSGTNDAGAGMLTALGLIPHDASDAALPPGGAALYTCKDIAGTIALPDGIELIGASDVDNPLIGPEGASAVFGPQKGATEPDVAVLDDALSHWAGVLEDGLPGCPAGLARLPGGGAAGGLGAAILALGGRIISGIDLVRDQTGLDAALAGADLVITGEGSFDHQSLRGKVIAGVAGAARDRGIPCVVLAGRVTTGRREQGSAGVTEALSLVDHFGSVDLAMAEPARGLSELASRLARQYSRGAQ